MNNVKEDETFSRPYYIKRLETFAEKNIIKVLTGQRRVGKSCIMKDFAAHLRTENPDSNVIYIDKENFAFRDINDAASLYDYVESKLEKSKKNYLFIDEVQEIQEFEKALRSFHNTNSADIYVTGSNAKMLSSDIATLLSGRYVEIDVHPLSFLEFLEFNHKENSDENLMKYLKFGGLPYLIHLEQNDAVVFEYLKNVYSTILLKDIVQREKIRNVDFLEILSAYVAENIGSLFSATNISKFLKSQKVNISPAVVINYLKAFCDAHFVSKVERAEISGLKKFEVGQKFYFEDTGLRNCITGFDFSRDIGKILENAVFNHLLRQGWEIFVGYAGANGNNEIDFAATKNDGGETKKMYVQVCYLLTDENSKREFGNLEKINDNFPKYVVSMNPGLSESSHNGIAHVHLRKFLEKVF